MGHEHSPERRRQRFWPWLALVTDVPAAAPRGRPTSATKRGGVLFCLQLLALLLCVVWTVGTAFTVHDRISQLLTPLPCLAVLVGAADLVVRRCPRPRRAVAATVVALPLLLLFWTGVVGIGMDRMGSTFPGYQVWGFGYWAVLFLAPVVVPMLAIRWAERGVQASYDSR